jgi:hypothetical protein
MLEQETQILTKYQTEWPDSGNTTLVVREEVPFLQFANLSKYQNEIVHGFSTRLGGVSQMHLSSMNVSFSRGDKTENVMENHRRLGAAMGYDYRKLVFSDQVHKTEIRSCTKADCGKGITRESDIREIDGLITNEPGVPLITFYADCVPLFFYCPTKKVVALAHSGWRGTVAGIGQKMVERMVQEYGCRRQDILCAIGPSICQDCYEVSRDVIEEFEAVYTEEELQSMVYAKGNGKYQLDLKKACGYNFLKAGILRSQICEAEICTCCNPELLYSHRASHGMRGNLGAVIMLR